MAIGTTNFNYDMCAAQLGASVSVSLLNKAIEQTEIQAAGLLQMLPPPAGLNEVGGLLDVRV
jgi:hypothetical protein